MDELTPSTRPSKRSGIVHQGPDAIVRLAQLGFRQPSVVRSALQDGASSARAASTTMHPPSYAGVRMWGETTAALGFLAQLFGFEHEVVHGVDFVANHAKGVVVIVTAGDNATGFPSFDPQVRYPRKDVTAEIINGGLDRLWDSGRPDWQVWLLLHFLDRGDPIVPAELSRPTGVVRGGLVRSWEERIIVPESTPGTQGGLFIEEPQAVEAPQVVVSRRVS